MGKTVVKNVIKPVVLKEGSFGKRDLAKIKTTKIWQMCDLYKEQLEELFEMLYASEKDNKIKLSQFLKERLDPNPNLRGTWVYFPWRKILIHMLNEKDYFILRTNRNRELITLKEQKQLKNFTIGIAGLSIGSNIALASVHLGASQNLKIADFDNLATSNLNRVIFGLPEIGKNKAQLTAQKLYEINPFINLRVFDKGLTRETLDDFVSKQPKLNLVIDEIDDFEIKVRIRLMARKEMIPVLMVTSLGDGCLIDVERYDIDPKMKLFNGFLGNLSDKILKSKLTEEEKKKFAAQLVGIENIPTRALKSLLEIGKTLVGRPQLVTTVSVGVGVAGFLARKIALDEHCPSGRYLLHLRDAIFANSSKAPYAEDIGRKGIISQLMKG